MFYSQKGQLDVETTEYIKSAFNYLAIYYVLNVVQKRN